MADVDDFWSPENLENEPCDTCGTKPSRHEGHGSFTCKSCYDARWCPKCSYPIYGDLVDGKHVCARTEVLEERKRECGITMLCIADGKEQRLAFELAEELTRSEPLSITGYNTYCDWCYAHKPDESGDNFHKDDCKWWRFRKMFEV